MMSQAFKIFSDFRQNSPVKSNCYTPAAILKGLIVVFRYYLDRIIDSIFSLFWDGKYEALPDLEKNVNFLTESATSLARKIKNRQLKSEDLVRACIQRIKVVNPVINAVTDERFEDALKEACEVDKKIEEGLSDEYFEQKPFLGVPFTAKESHQVAGLLNTLGIQARRHIRACTDAECVRLLREAGAIPLAVTNVPEINKWQETRNMVFGQTNNPYHAGRTCGGSSGGEAALSASFASPISLCSDIGGSTRMPAFYCGLFGHNPTAGTTSLKGSALRTGKEDTMASIGFICRHAEDLLPLTSIITKDVADVLRLDRKINIKKIKFYYMESAYDLRVSTITTDLRTVMKQVIDKVSEVSEQPAQLYSHQGFNHMYSLWRHRMTYESEKFAKMLTNNAYSVNAVPELFKKLVGLSSFTLAAVFKLFDDQIMPPVDRDWAEQELKKLKNDLVSTLGEDGVLLFPSAPQAAPYHYSCFLRPYNFAYWAIFNALRMPATQVPIDRNSAGMPLGVQVVAAPHNDALCLAVADYLGKTFDRIAPPCKVYE